MNEEKFLYKEAVKIKINKYPLVFFVTFFSFSGRETERKILTFILLKIELHIRRKR